MIQNITIENFRQFDYLKVNDFKRVNFLVGKNNCGKTSVLEALFWSLAPFSIESIGSMHFFRRMIVTPENIKTLFKDKDETTPMKINITTTNKKKQGFELVRNTDIANQLAIYKDTQQLHNHTNIHNTYKCRINYEEQSNQPTVYNGSMITGLSVNPITNMPDLRLQFQLHNINNDTPLKSITLTGAFISDYVGKELMIQQLNNINDSLDKRKQIEKYLQHFDLDIQSIEFGANNSINIITKHVILPLEVMGDGFNKYLRIVVGLINNGINILFIDEIENGLHHLTQRKLLKIILTLSQQKNIQLFITTHSLETLKFLSEIMQEEDFLEQKDDVQIIKLSNEDDTYRALIRSIDDLDSFIETETEIR